MVRAALDFVHRVQPDGQVCLGFLRAQQCGRERILELKTVTHFGRLRSSRVATALTAASKHMA